MNFSDFYSGSALGGAASGAITGLMAAGPYGALAGGVIGGFGGAYANSKRDQGAQAQAQNLDLIRQNLQRMNNQNYARYMQQLQKAQSFYGPVMDTWDSIYGKAGDRPLRSKMGMK